MNNIKQILPNISKLCLGLFIIAFSCSLFVYSNLGADPFNLMTQGIARLLHIQVGTINIILQFSFGVIWFVASKNQLRIGTVISVFFIGFVMNICSFLFADALGSASFIFRMICVFLAPIFIGFGVALVKIADLGMIPNDLLSLFIFERIGKFEFRWVRITYDFTQFAIGVALGSIFGIGTLFSVLLTGPSIQLAMSLLLKEEVKPNSLS